MKKSAFVFLILALSPHSFSQCYDIYGLSSTGGEYGAGAIVKMDESGNFNAVYSFYQIDTWRPEGHFCKAADGSLYALSHVLFQWDPETNIYSKKVKFGTCYPLGSLMQAKNGKFFGMTQSNRFAPCDAVLFEWDAITGTYTERYKFESDFEPQGSLIQTQGGLLYGMTSSGGANNCGVLFRWDPESGIFSKLADFDATESGFDARGSLCIAENGKLYGVTRSGGVNGVGVLFEYDPVSDTLIKRHDFNEIESGSHPESSPVLAQNGKLYGTAVEGGLYGYGVLYEFDPVTSGFFKILDFDGADIGRNPVGALTPSEDGILVGVTLSSVFEFNPGTQLFTKKTGFQSLDLYPTSALIQAVNGKFYGFSATGGIVRPFVPPFFNYGVIYEWDPVSDSCSVKLRFMDTFYGAQPKSIGYSNSKFYGTSSKNGYCNWGMLFEFDPQNNEILMKSGLSGVSPGPLMKSINGKFYGWTRNDPDCGDYSILFEWDPITEQITQKYAYHYNGHTFPKGPFPPPNDRLIEANNGKIYYGTGYNALIEWDVERDTLINKYSLDEEIDGSRPRLILSAKNGKLLGNTENGGLFNHGTLFEWDPVTNIFNKLLDLSFNTPVSSIYQMDSSRFYGAGNRGSSGIFYEFDRENNLYKTIYSFNVIDDESAYLGKDLTLADNEKLYGTINTVDSGYYFFKWDLLNNSFKKLFELENPDYNGIRFIDFEMIRRYEMDTITVASCYEYISPSGKFVWKESGVYNDTIIGISGCDSIITIHLAIDTVNTLVTQDEAVLSSQALNSVYQWIDCKNGNIPIDGETQQTFTAAIDGNYAVIVNQNGCIDTSECFEVNLTGLIYSNFRNNVKLYPNPSDGSFTVDMGRIMPEYDVTVFQPDGRAILKKSVKNRQTIEMQIKASPGYYIVAVSTRDEQALFKVLKR